MQKNICFADQFSKVDAQEFENRFWTVFAVLLASACTFVNDSPLYMGDTHPGWGLLIVLVLGYAVHMWDRITLETLIRVL